MVPSAVRQMSESNTVHTMETPPLTNGYHNDHSDDLLTQEVPLTNSSGPNIPNKSDTTSDAFLQGPNQIFPATSYVVTEPTGRVKLRIGKKGSDAEPPLSVPGLMSRTVARYPDKIAYAFKLPDDTWEKVTFREYHQNVRICAKAFLKMGLEKHHSVCVLGFNCPQWFIADLAAIHAGGFAAGIYTTNNPEACYHVLNNSRANIVVVEDSKQMDKIRAVWPRLPSLKAAVQLEGDILDSKDKIFSWSQVMAWGRDEPDTKLNEALKAIGVNECCTLVYTSGTVGKPKGVMLSHDNVIWEAFAVSEMVEVDPGNESLISYLPLSHVAAQILDIFVPLMNAISVYFADRDALKGSLIKTIQEVQPTRFLGVPRVWEKIHEKMTSIGEANGFVKRCIAGWAKSKSLNHHMRVMKGIKDNSYGFWFAQWLVLNRVKAALGFSNCKMFVTAAAPLSPDIKTYFLSLDIPVIEVFGMSESAGAHSFGQPDDFNLESVGKPINGSETMISNIDPATGEGEICLRGRHIFMGYLNEPGKTNEAFDAEGWLHSGDVGKVDESGFLFITGRIKELIITAGGENVAPVIIEQQIKKELPCISQAVVIGDRRKFLSVLLTFKTENDNDSGMPLDNLSSDALRWVASVGEQVTTVTEILSGPNQKIMNEIQEGLNRANVHAISNAQKVQKFAILSKDLSTATDELGPTLKIKRNIVAAKYADIIESLYQDAK